MSVTSPPRIAPNELMEALVLLSEPVRFKEHIKQLAAATKKINIATAKYDAAVKIASTVERAQAFAQERRTEIDKAEERAAETAATVKAKHIALEASMSRREGAHKMLVKEHEEAYTARRNELNTLVSNLVGRENMLERGKKQLKQDNTALKTAQDALSERRARLAQALKN